MVIKLLITTWVVLVINQLITTWVVLVTKHLVTTWIVAVTKQLMTASVVFIIKFIMVVVSWEVVGIKQISSIETSVVITKTFTTGSINNMGKRPQIFSISSIQQFHR